MKIKNLKKSLAVLTAAVLLAASIPMSAFNVFAVSNTYDITYEDGVTTVGGVESTVADAFKVLEIKDTTTDYSEEATEADGKLSIPVSARTSSNGDNTGSYMFTLQNAPAGDLLSYELTIPTKNFIGRPTGLLIPLYYDQGTNRYVSVFSVTRSGNTYFQIGRAFITTKYYGYYRNSDTEVKVTYPSVSSVNVKVSYNYQDDTISSVDIKFVLYDSSNTELATLSKTYTKAAILQAVNINSSTTGLNGKPATWEEEDVNVTSLAKSGALVGFISGPTAGTMNTISSFKASYSKAAGDVAAEFVNEYKSYITMDESAVTADNANGVIAAHSAYTALDDAVKTVLASYEIDGALYNVGEKLSALIAVAAPFVPTAAQTEFENYYTAQNIADLTVADGNLDTIEEALRLYNAVEDTHKVNVSTQYAHISSLLDSFVNNLSRFEPSLGANTFTYAPGEFSAYPNLLGYMNNRIWSTSSGGQSRVSSDLLAATDVRKITAVFNKANAGGAVVNMVSDLAQGEEDPSIALNSYYGVSLTTSSADITTGSLPQSNSAGIGSTSYVIGRSTTKFMERFTNKYDDSQLEKYNSLNYIALDLDYDYIEEGTNNSVFNNVPHSKLAYTANVWADNGDGVYDEAVDVLMSTYTLVDYYNYIAIKYYNDAPRTLQYGIPTASVAKLYSVKLSTAADETSAAAYNFVEAHKTAITAASATVENAQAIIDAYTAYTALDEAVKTVLASYVIDGVPYNVGTKLSALNDAAVPLMPTEAQTAFEEYYNANIEALTAADGKLAEINTALGLYNAVEDSHKGNVSAQYAHICSLLDGYFITDNAEALTKDLTYDSSSLTGFDNVKSYFKNSVFVETANSRNNKVTDPAKFDSTKARSIKVAFTYGEKNAAGTDYKTGIGFNIFPVVGSIDGLTANSDKKMFAPGTRANKTVYVNGESVGSGKGVYGYLYADNNFAYIEDVNTNTANQFFKSKGNIGNIEWTFGSYYTSASKYQASDFSNTYQLPADRIVFDFDYTVTTTVDAKGYKLLKITFSNITVWAESDGNNSYDDGVDIKLTSSSGAILAYRYNEDTAPMPFFSTDDTSLDSMLYFESSVDYTFEEKYAGILDNLSPEAAKTLEMYAEYQADTSAVSAETAAKVETAVTNAGLRPTANGATLSVSADTHIGFYVDKPVATGVESTVGALVSAYNYMVDNHISVLTKGMGDEGVLEATPQSNEYCGVNQLMLKVKNLYGAEKNWGNWIVVRYYATYTVNGNEVVIYSTGENANNPATATAVSPDGVAIRSINYLIKRIATEMKDKVETNGNTVGIDYVDKNGATKSVYTGKTLSEAVAANGGKTIFSTALDTMYFLMSYKNAL